MTPDNKDLAGLLPSSEGAVADVPVEMWCGKRKVTIYKDSVLRSWGTNIETDMSDEPRSLSSVQSAFEWLRAAPGAAIAAREQETPATVLTEEDLQTLVDTHGFTGDFEEMAREVEALVLSKLGGKPYWVPSELASSEQEAPETIQAKVDRINLSVMRRFTSMWHADAVRLGYDGVGSLLESLLASRQEAPVASGEPIDMVLHCPKCRLQHVDNREHGHGPYGRTVEWDNPPHRSHLCHGCGHIWRPADVPTNGVQAIKTTGKADSPLASPSGAGLGGAVASSEAVALRKGYAAVPLRLTRAMQDILDEEGWQWADLLMAAEATTEEEDEAVRRFESLDLLEKAEREAAANAAFASSDVHPATADLVTRFSAALLEKLAAAEKKYGYSDGWLQTDWMDECRTKLLEHVAKGDPRDVAAYCAFLWHHGESTASQPGCAVEGEVVRSTEVRATAWREYAEHQEYCQTCAESVNNCDTGRTLKLATLAAGQPDAQ